MAAIVVTVVAMVGLPIGAYYVGRCWSTPIREMREPWTWWTRLTRFLTHNRPTQRVLRLLGANARSSWMFLTNIVPIGATLGGWWWLHSRLDDLAEAVAVERGRKIAVYAIITILVLAMAALGCFVAGKKQPRERLWLNIGRRGVFLLFGVIVALLVIWTPYAWACLVCRNHFFIPVVIALFPLTMLFQLGRTFFPRSLSVRRVTTALGFCGLAAIAVVVPLCFVDMDGSSVTSSYSPTWSVMAAFLGAYFASLWVGWYFCICLQWNAHGNEAGSAARITDYGEFLRIKLTPYEAEVWAIAVEEALDPKPSLYYRLSGRKATTVDRKPPTARLIDHFRVNVPTRRGPPQGPDRPPPNTELPTVPATPASAQLPMPIGPEKPPIE